jgi:chemotaxis protein CheD
VTLLYDDFGSHESSPFGRDETTIEIFLDPGEFFVGDANFQVRTLLGSCVSMVLWHRRMRYGAMSHFMLATRNASERPSNTAQTQCLDGKYADEVLEIMMHELKQAKVPLHECVAKVVGGGNMFPNQMLADHLDVGKKNGRAAIQLLRSKNFGIVAEDLYGIGHREVIFNLGNGDIWVKQGSPILKTCSTS